MDLVRIDEVLSALEKTLKDTRIISKQSKKCISERFCSELRMLPIYNPEKQEELFAWMIDKFDEICYALIKVGEMDDEPIKTEKTATKLNIR